MISSKLTFVAAIVTISLCTISYASSNHGHSRLAVALKPEYLTFKYDQGALEINELDDLLQSLLGYSIHSDIKWKGLVNKQALSMPNAIMLFLGDSSYINLESFSSKLISVDQKHHHIDMNSFDSLEGTNTAVKKYNSLSAPLEFSSDCKTASNPEVYIFKITQDDTEQLAKSIDKIVTSYQTNCTSDLLALVLTYKEHSTVTEENTANVRSKRAASSDPSTITNEAVFYSDNYPAMFNLFFWTGLLLAVTIFGVSYCMWNMDPGLDTVIYRMTSQRTKKDQ